MSLTVAAQRLRYAFILEATLNIVGGLFILAFPRPILTHILASPDLVTSSSISLLQWLGGLSCSLAAPLVVGLPTDTQAPERRKAAYWTLLAGEIALVPMMLVQALGNEEKSGITRKSLLVAAGVLAGPALGRVYVLARKPEWFGEEKSVSLQE